jgi:hypothetical protein
VIPLVPLVLVTGRDRSPTDGGAANDSRYGWLYKLRAKKKNGSCRPMNRALKVHLKSLRPDVVEPDQPVFCCGSSRANAPFQRLGTPAGVKPKQDVETCQEKP